MQKPLFALYSVSDGCHEIITFVGLMNVNSAFSQSREISLDLCCFYGGGIRHNEDIMKAFKSLLLIVSLPTSLPPVETRISKLVVRALNVILISFRLFKNTETN